ncbi:MAG: hypothetical protein ACFB03_23420 [Paracoccaceae bacterium]|mgnify:CR=1 FL=1
MPWDGTFTGNSSKRADRPNWRSSSDYNIQFKPSDSDVKLAFHHICDWALLRDTWNRLVDDKHYATICCWLYAVGFDVKNTYHETGEPQTPVAIATQIMKGEDVYDVADADEVHTRITWSTWNLVEGPKEDTRSDDRGNFHDRFSNVRGGISESERADLTGPDRLYSIMSGLNLSQPIPLLKAIDLSKALMSVNRKAKVIKFREQMWTKASGGMKKCWRKNLQ